MSSALSQLCIHSSAAALSSVSSSRSSFFTSSLPIYCHLTSTSTQLHFVHPMKVIRSILSVPLCTFWSRWPSPAQVFDSIDGSLPETVLSWFLRCPPLWISSLVMLSFMGFLFLSLTLVEIVVFSWLQCLDSMLVSVLTPHPQLCRGLQPSFHKVMASLFSISFSDL